MDNCTVPPSGWRCTRAAGHDGPCAAIPSYMSPNATLWREIDALGGSGDDGHSQALDKVLAILERRGFTEHSDPFTTPTPDRFGEGYRAGVEAAAGECQAYRVKCDRIAVERNTAGESMDAAVTCSLAAELLERNIRALHPATGNEA